MTDMTLAEALAEIQRTFKHGGYWPGSLDPALVRRTIIHAAATGKLVPAADAWLAVADMQALIAERDAAETTIAMLRNVIKDMASRGHAALADKDAAVAEAARLTEAGSTLASDESDFYAANWHDDPVEKDAGHE